MNEYIQVTFPDISTEQMDILIAELSENGFEGFEESEKGLNAYIPKNEFDENLLSQIASSQNAPFVKSTIEDRNWNSEWESNFEPIVADDFVGVRADFHQPLKNVKHEIIITPKMSFGTGHHATTFMMIQQMGQVDFVGKTVFDFGTGTGILAILSEKLGAKKIIAVDIDDWSIENAAENLQKNFCSRVDLRKTDLPPGGVYFDIILANINKNVILENFKILMNQVDPGAIIIFSGLLVEDEDVIFRKSIEYSLQLIQTSVRDNWLCLRFSC